MKVTAQQVLEINSRARNVELIVKLANDVLASDVPVRDCDPIQVWENHPVVCRYLDSLKDREIAIAIGLAASSKESK